MKHLICSCALFLTMAGVTATAQQASIRPAAAKPQGVTVNGVISMAEAGLSDDVILARLYKEQKPFDLSPDDMIRLKKAKVSDAILKAMLDPKAAVPAPTPAPQPQQPAQQVVVTTPALAGLTPAKPSGATPGAGAAASGDPNDPMSPHDSGIYVYTKDHDGNAQLVVLERAGYQGSKTGGMLASAMTYGLKKMKTKAVIPGPRASVRVSDASPVFYFYFDDKQAGLGKTNFGIGSLSNPNQFALLKLEVNKANRETIIGQYGALGMSSGSDANAMVPFKSERIRPGLYKVTVEGMRMGEYCFLASSGQGSAMAAGAMAAVDIFDFGMSVE
jgi:hypothetical protein